MFDGEIHVIFANGVSVNGKGYADLACPAFDVFGFESEVKVGGEGGFFLGMVPDSVVFLSLCGIFISRT